MDGNIGRILLPTDFSQESFLALEYAINLARRHLSEIILIHVVQPLPRGVARWYEPSNLLEEHAELARKRMEEFETRALTLYPHCRSEIHFGNVARIAATLITRLEVDLVVVSARRRSGIFDWIGEKLPESLVRLVTCPVLVLRPQVTGASVKASGSQFKTAAVIHKVSSHIVRHSFGTSLPTA